MSDVFGVWIVMFLLALLFAIIMMLGFGVTICRGTFAERRRLRNH